MEKNLNQCSHDDIGGLQIEGDSDGLKETGTCTACGAQITSRYKLVSTTIESSDGSTTEECF
jgi:hypothetical protein